jgi:hypothetical protein
MTHGPSLQAMSVERLRRYDETTYCQVHGVVEVVVPHCEDCLADGGSPMAEAILEGVPAAVEPAASPNRNVDTLVCMGQPPQAMSNIRQRRMVGDALSVSGSFAQGGNEELPTEPPLLDMDDDMPYSFEPPLPSRMSHDAGVDVESQTIR